VGRSDHPVSPSSVGQPFGRTFSTANNVRILAEPIGTRRMNNITLLDVRVEKGFTLGGHRRFAGFVDVFNLTTLREFTLRVRRARIRRLRAAAGAIRQRRNRARYPAVLSRP
jgi:hypothetical protein